MAHIPKYKASQPNKQFIRYPETYLNNESWLNEIIEAPLPPLYDKNGVMQREQTKEEYKQELSNFMKQYQ